MATLTHTAAGDSIAGSGYRGIVLDRLAKQATEILDVDESCIFVHDQEDPDTAIVAAARGADEAMVGKRVPVEVEFARGRHGALVQLLWDGEVQGALSIDGAAVDEQVSSSDSALLAAFAPTVAAAIWHAHVRSDTRPDVRKQIAALTAALDRRDGYTGRHSEEVMGSARTLGRRMGLDAAGLAELEVAALLHDIGKILVPDSILNKSGRLTPDEHARMTEHPGHGAQILARVPGLEAVATIVRYHHERWDGAGYPDGLAGARIPLASRIIAVCDSFSAMTSDRPYRRAIARDDALAELRAHAGRQFDPDVAFAVASMVRAPAAA
jgi:HD-GYP domain-containing protein (c-di-GMP phosphodiesterase class II)